MIVKDGHSSFGTAGPSEIREPKSFLAHLQENLEAKLPTTTDTPPPVVVTDFIGKLINEVPPYISNMHDQDELERQSRVFGDKKVTTFYLHMSIAISTFIVLIFLGISAYMCYKRREFQSMEQPQTPRRRSSNGPNRKGSHYSNERMPINLR